MASAAPMMKLKPQIKEFSVAARPGETAPSPEVIPQAATSPAATNREAKPQEATHPAAKNPEEIPPAEKPPEEIPAATAAEPVPTD